MKALVDTNVYLHDPLVRRRMLVHSATESSVFEGATSLRQDPNMGSAVYNTLTNDYSGPAFDSTYNAEVRVASLDSLAMQLLFYDEVVCLADNLAVIPLLAETVGLEYLLELLRRHEVRFLRTREAVGMRDGEVIFVSVGDLGKATFGPSDWPKIVFAKELPEAAAWVARRGFSYLDEPQIQELREAIIGATTDVPQGPIRAAVFDGLDAKVADLNESLIKAGHHKADVVRLEHKGEGRRVVVLSDAIDRNRLERSVLDIVALQHDAIIPSLAGVEVVGSDSVLHRCLPLGEQQVLPVRGGESQSPGGSLRDEDLLVLESVRRTLDIPNVGGLLRQEAITREMLVEIRESKPGKGFRQWFAEKGAEDPTSAASEARELIASRAKGSVGARTVDLLLSCGLSTLLGVEADKVGIPAPVGFAVGAVANALCWWHGRTVGKMLFDRRHPLTIVERLRRAASQKGSS